MDGASYIGRQAYAHWRPPVDETKAVLVHVVKDRQFFTKSKENKTKYMRLLSSAKFLIVLEVIGQLVRIHGTWIGIGVVDHPGAPGARLFFANQLLVELAVALSSRVIWI